MRVRFDLSALSRRRSAKFALASLAAVVVITTVTFTVRAWRNKKDSAVRRDTIAAQPTPVRGQWQNRLALQPEADKQRHRLGHRFLTTGREVSVLAGTLTLGSERYVARITRRQDNDDERLTIALNGGPDLRWSGLKGALSGDSLATGDRRSLIERIALYSPDQFILSQLRGARYFLVAKAVRPAEIGGAVDYSGPVWDVIRVDEPAGNNPNKPLGLWRLYYINLKTGLIDKIVSQEQGQLITAEISGWVNQDGELSPTRILWTRNKQPIMELTFTKISYEPKQGSHQSLS